MKTRAGMALQQSPRQPHDILAESSPEYLADELLALTKMNWDQTQTSLWCNVPFGNTA